jgi:RNA polymerase sigma-70 factor (ECF subfamily)
MIQAKNGNGEAYSALYEAVYTPVFRYVYQRTLDHETAEDITQTVFLKAFQSIERYSDQGFSPLAYFFTIARNAIIDLGKKNRKECLVAEDDPIFEQIEEPYQTPIKKMKEKEQQVAIQEAMKRLRPDQRDALTLRFINGFKNSEIANIMGKSEVLIRQLQCRGIKQLQTFSHLKYYL